ncbi:MAG: polyprenol monophosphomannose synthase [Candidatus Omnitrophota bacterium]|jgi:dolichol-phosphate mannosyltransferase
MTDTLIIIPTYNEKENIEAFISEVLRHAGGSDVLIVDDDSSDGTADIIDNIANGNNRVTVMHRMSGRGRGLAGIDAFKEALKRREIEYVIEMDGDFSHDPAYIPVFLKEIKDADVVIGSRYVRGGKDRERSLIRIIMSKLVNLFIRKYMGFNIRDCSSGYRCFRREVLSSINWNNIISKEPSIIEEVLYECKLKRYKIKEIPIVFKERRLGYTKLGFTKLTKVFIDIIKIKNSKHSISN